jgi:hypothetical protein
MAAAWLFLAMTLICVVGAMVDDRKMLDESVWIKPLKFSFAFGAYSATMAWMISIMTKARRFSWWTGTVFAVVSVLEVAAVSAAGISGTVSHFNMSNGLLNQLVQASFEYGVPVLYLMNVILAITVLFQRTGDRVMSWALRTGLALSTVGMTMAFALIGYGPTRLVTDGNGGEVRMRAGHGIGELDGRGMFLTNWSADGGDMRVPHFIGLHGLHVMIAVALILGGMATRRQWLRDDRIRARLVGIVGLGYAGLLAVLSWQAARGQSLIHPDAKTLTAMGAVALVTVAGALAIAASAKRRTAGENTAETTGKTTGKTTGETPDDRAEEKMRVGQ